MSVPAASEAELAEAAAERLVNLAVAHPEDELARRLARYALTVAERKRAAADAETKVSAMASEKRQRPRLPYLEGE